jgi:hypothetical protein
VRRAPSLGRFEAIGASSPTSLFVPSPSLHGTEGEVSATPSSGSRIVDSS